jgi:hypothetical protein
VSRNLSRSIVITFFFLISSLALVIASGELPSGRIHSLAQVFCSASASIFADECSKF